MGIAGPSPVVGLGKGLLQLCIYLCSVDLTAEAPTCPLSLPYRDIPQRLPPDPQCLHAHCPALRCPPAPISFQPQGVRMVCGVGRRNPSCHGCAEPSKVPTSCQAQLVHGLWASCPSLAQGVVGGLVRCRGSLDWCPLSMRSPWEAASRSAAPTSATRDSRSCGWSASGWPCTAPCSTPTLWPPASSRYLGVRRGWTGLPGVDVESQ